MDSKYCNLCYIAFHAARLILLDENLDLPLSNHCEKNLLYSVVFSDGRLLARCHLLLTVTYTNNLVHRDNGSKTHSPLHHRICEKRSVTKGSKSDGNLPKASLAFASGNFSTMQLMFSSSVNSMASSASVAWPLGQDCTESP